MGEGCAFTTKPVRQGHLNQCIKSIIQNWVAQPWHWWTSMTQIPSRYNFTSGGNSCILGLIGDQAEYSPEVIYSPVCHQVNCCHQLSLRMKPWGRAKSNKLEKEVSEPVGQWTPQTSPAMGRECPSHFSTHPEHGTQTQMHTVIMERSFFLPWILIISQA